MCYYPQNPKHQPTTLSSHIAGWLITLLMVLAFVLLLIWAGRSDAEALRDSRTAFYPAKPSHAQQVAYREDAREQLRLQTIARGGL